MAASIRAFGGLIVWGAHFLVVYCSAAVLCAKGLAEQDIFDMRPIVVVAIGSTIVALLALGVLAIWPAGRPLREAIAEHDADQFLIWQSRSVALLSVVGVVYVAGAVVVLGDTCR
ncbi:MAG: hypothetical protein AB7O95_07055 [Geminicoccaceae bacterium]